MRFNPVGAAAALDLARATERSLARLADASLEVDCLKDQITARGLEANGVGCKAMTDRVGHGILSCVVLVGALTGAYAVEAPPARATEAQAVASFVAHVKEYVALHEKLESTLPRFPKRSTPEQIDKNQRALGDLIKAARRDARPGEFFTPGMQAFVRRVLGEVLSGPDGKTVKASIMDENPGVPKLVLNERYPSSVPLSTMPPQVLAPLPKLEGELEYRFLGPRLILLDTEADIILDFTDDVVPH